MLKGGFALELRIPDRARATKDLDLALFDAGDSDVLLDRLDVALDADLGDGFIFVPTPFRPIAADDAGNPAWRTTVVARLGGVEFAKVVIDMVARPAESGEAIDRLSVQPVVPGLGYESIEFPTIDVAQHAAEKFHAMCRRYSGDRPSSRVKDLVDLVLMLDAGLLPCSGLAAALRRTWRSRDQREPPGDIPDPPQAWRTSYAHLASELDVDVRDIDSAMSAVRDLYLATLTSRRSAEVDTEDTASPGD